MMPSIPIIIGKIISRGSRKIICLGNSWKHRKERIDSTIPAPAAFL